MSNHNIHNNSNYKKKDNRASFVLLFIIAIPLIIFLYDSTLFNFLTEEVKTGVNAIKQNLPKASAPNAENLLSVKELAGQSTYTSLQEALEAKKARKLSLTAQKLEFIPTNLAKLTYLQALNLDRNQITDLTLPVDNLLSLQYLNISLNKIKNLNMDIGKLENLIRLDATANILKNVPLEIVKLRNLQTLILRYNQLENIPSAICDLNNLDTLSLGFNKILRLPRSLTNLRNLEYLDLEHNVQLDVGHFIQDFENFKKLKVLKLGGIPIKESDKALLRQVLPNTQIYFK